MVEYCELEIQKIVDLYLSGFSFTKIGLMLHRQKNDVKKILKERNVWVEGRDILKIDLDEPKVIELYESGLSLVKVGELFGVSKTVIKRILLNSGKLRNGYSDGKKIELTPKKEEMIKFLYLEKFYNIKEISSEVGLTESFIDKFLSNSGYRRDKSKAMSLIKLGVPLSDKVRENMKIAQQKLAKSGKRLQTGGVCKNYIIGDLKCNGTYELFYINKLIKDDCILPKNCGGINTPYGVYYPDFEYHDRFIEIKSNYTYDVLIGLKKSRWTNKVDITQYKKIKWVNQNVKPVDILVVDKKLNNVTKKIIS